MKDAPTVSSQSTKNNQLTQEDYITDLPTTCSEAAHWWFDFGFKVVPIDPAAKSTAVCWQKWLDNLSHESIKRHWKKHPNHELGAIVDDAYSASS